MLDQSALQRLQVYCHDKNLTLVAVTKTKPVEDILEAYNAGQKVFGENYVQELVEKYEQLPKDIKWHLMGHLQKNKVKYVAPFISLIQSVDSWELLVEINRQAQKCNRVIDCLLQIKIGQEETKFGFTPETLDSLLSSQQVEQIPNVRIRGVMGIATNIEDTQQITTEFTHLQQIFVRLKASNFKNADTFDAISMGMSHDYEQAIKAGSTMLRIGSLIFGSR